MTPRAAEKNARRVARQSSSMPVLNGNPLKKGEKLSFVWNADLVAFDGPLISLFKKGDDDFLFVWVDCDERRNRWLAVKLDRQDLQGYLLQHITLLNIFENADIALVFETTKTAQKRNYRFISPNQIPDSYLPQEDSYLDPSIATQGARTLAEDMPTKYTINLDGELYLDDLASVPKLYQQLYSFHYGLAHLGREAVRDALGRLLEKWRGGINAVNLFTGLRTVTPSIHRAQIKELQFASPGHIQLELLAPLAKEIQRTCARITPDAKFEEAQQLYSEVYAYFRREKISGFEIEGFNRAAALTATQNTRISSFVERFFVLMGWDAYKANFTALGLDPMAKMRLILAYYRRLRELREFVSEDKVELT